MENVSQVCDGLNFQPSLATRPAATTRPGVKHGKPHRKHAAPDAAIRPPPPPTIRHPRMRRFHSIAWRLT